MYKIESLFTRKKKKPQHFLTPNLFRIVVDSFNKTLNLFFVFFLTCKTKNVKFGPRESALYNKHDNSTEFDVDVSMLTLVRFLSWSEQMQSITSFCSYARPAQPGPNWTRLCGPCLAAIAGD